MNDVSFSLPTGVAAKDCLLKVIMEISNALYSFPEQVRKMIGTLSFTVPPSEGSIKLKFLVTCAGKTKECEVFLPNYVNDPTNAEPVPMFIREVSKKMGEAISESESTLNEDGVSYALFMKSLHS
mgnify:FL=1